MSEIRGWRKRNVREKELKAAAAQCHVRDKGLEAAATQHGTREKELEAKKEVAVGEMEAKKEVAATQQEYQREKQIETAAEHQCQS